MANILIVEDEKNMQEIIAEYMQRSGHVCYTADDGADDYMTKPFSPKVLLAKTNALLFVLGERNHTLKNILVIGVPEWKIFLSKLASALVIVIIFTGILTVYTVAGDFSAELYSGC